MYSKQYIERHTRWLRRDLSDLDSWYDALIDEEGVHIGRAFRDAFVATGCREGINPEKSFSGANYKPYEAGSGFVNKILYGATARQNKAPLFLARIHESIHAMQFHKAAIAHTDLFNPRTRIVLCPWDSLRLRELVERDAHGKEVWLSALAQRQSLFSSEDVPDSLIPAHEYETIRKEEIDLSLAIVEIADRVMKKGVLVRSADGTDTIECRDIYHHHALRDFSYGLQARQPDLRAGNITFARLEPEDIEDIGNSFGPNIYGQNASSVSSMDVSTLMVNNRDVLDQINGFLGIGDERDLPAFGEVLAAQGMTRESFLAESRGEELLSDSENQPKLLAYP